MIYCAIDPGGTTGWAAWNSDVPVADSFISGETEGRFAFRQRFDNIFMPSPPGHITFIIEDFTISARTVTTKLDYSALRIIGYVELVCEKHGYALHFQRPAQIKSKATIGTDINLKKLGWYRAGHGGHANDAAKHVLVHVRNMVAAKHLMRKIAA